MQHDNLQYLQGARYPVHAKIVFGSPGNNCKGNGICKVVPFATNTSEWLCRVFECRIWLEKEVLNLQVLHLSRDDSAIISRFNRGGGVIEQPFHLPLFLLKKLHLGSGVVIPQSYPLKWEGSTLLFQLIIQ
jgi:hypothetical protein